MKKSAVVFLSTVILIFAMYNAVALNVSNTVYADSVTVEAGEQVTVPIKIKNNDGFMGFSVIVRYDSKAFSPVSVSKGSMLSGMFNDSIETSTDNSFKVIFTGTGNVTSDGILFNVVFDVLDSALGAYDIELSYSQQDTFKEDWSNAVFSCEKAEIVVTVNGTTAPTSVTTEPTSAVVTKPSSGEEETTTKPSPTDPDTEGTTTQPATEPSTKPSAEPEPGKALSVRMREWVNALPLPLNIILGIFVVPVAFVISIFE